MPTAAAVSTKRYAIELVPWAGSSYRLEFEDYDKGRREYERLTRGGSRPEYKQIHWIGGER